MALQCGRGEYVPQRIPIPDDGGVIDVDGTWPGDYFTCPKHPDHIVYVQGQHFWDDITKDDPRSKEEWGWLGWNEVEVGGFCVACPGFGPNVKFTVGSYGG